jgi:hypothetical protein
MRPIGSHPHAAEAMCIEGSATPGSRVHRSAAAGCRPRPFRMAEQLSCCNPSDIRWTRGFGRVGFFVGLRGGDISHHLAAVWTDTILRPLYKPHDTREPARPVACSEALVKFALGVAFGIQRNKFAEVLGDEQYGAGWGGCSGTRFAGHCQTRT